MSKIAIFGGSFDPPHKGHLVSIQNVLNSGLVDELWLTPSGDNRYDKQPTATAEHREIMLKLLLAENFKDSSHVKLNLSQLSNPSDKGYTLDLLDSLKSQNPSNDFYFMIGADNIDYIKEWKNSDRLVSENKFLVLPRPGFTSTSVTSSHLIFLDPKKCESIEAASSEIRALVKEGRNLDQFLTPSIARYITEQGLYR